MDGFVARVRGAVPWPATIRCPRCSLARRPDVMGYHDAREIPNYWAYAHNFVLQDHMFEPDASWSLPAHLFMVSGWSANCTVRRPDELPSRAADPGSPPTQHGIRPASRRLRLDRPHLSPAQTPASAGATTSSDGQPARLRGRRRCSARRSRRTRRRRASGTRCPTSTPCARTASSATSSR